MSKLTKEQMHGMSDIQILRKLYELLGFEVHEYVFGEVITIRSGDKVTTAELSPNDIMPLQIEHKVSINYCPHLHAWTASAWKQTGKMESTMIDSYRCDESPLRAIACCLILVLQEKS